MVQVRLVYAIRSRSRRWAIRGLSRTHLAVHRVTRGRVLGSVAGMPVLLLTTTGRRSGKARTTPPHVRSRRDRPCDRIERRCGSFARLVAQSAADTARGRRDRDRQVGCHGEGGVGTGTRAAVGRGHGGVRWLRPLPGTDNATDTGRSSHTRRPAGRTVNRHVLRRLVTSGNAKHS